MRKESITIKELNRIVTERNMREELNKRSPDLDPVREERMRQRRAENTEGLRVGERNNSLLDKRRRRSFVGGE